MRTGDGSGHAAWKPPAPTAAQPVAESLVGYSDLREIGVGGDSVVYRATEDSPRRDVAIKVLDVNDEVRAARFAREVEITLDLGRQHPNIVTVLATGITGSGRPAIVMEFYPGGTLHDRLKEFGPLPVDEVVRIGLVLADALSFAHDRGVLHRDVKPQNVLVLPTSWVLADFGIARLVDSEHTGSVETFTYRHASPQVLDGHAPTAGDDIWSLGSTLYTLVDGRPPFASDDLDDDSALAYLRRARTERHRPLGVPGAEALAEVISRCLAKDTADRWSSAAEVYDVLLGLRHRGWEPGAAVAAPSTPATLTPPPGQPVSASTQTGAVEPGDTGDATDHTGHAWAPAPAPLRSSAPAGPEPVDPTAPRRPLDRDPVARGEVVDDERRARPPAPLALSAAAHVPVNTQVDAEPTGMGLPEDRLDTSSPEPMFDAVTPPPDRRRRRLVLALGAVALLIGTTLGVGGSILRDDDPTDTVAVDDGPAGRAIPELTEKPVENDTRVDVFNPELAFQMTDLTYEDGNVQIAWIDPSDGQAFFTLHQLRPDDFVREFDPGIQDDEFAMQLSLGRSCFVLVAHMPDEDLGQSNHRCLTNTGG